MSCSLEILPVCLFLKHLHACQRLTWFSLLCLSFEKSLTVFETVFFHALTFFCFAFLMEHVNTAFHYVGIIPVKAAGHFLTLAQPLSKGQERET